MLYVCTAVRNPRRTVNGGTLRYTNLTKTDAQVLQCNASNKHGYSYQNAYLNVLGELTSIAVTMVMNDDLL